VKITCKIFVLSSVILCLAGQTFGGTLVDTVKTADGKEYRDVKWGPVNKGKIVMFHNRGVAIVPLSDLPQEYRAQFGYVEPPIAKPVEKQVSPPATDSAPTSEPADSVAPPAPASSTLPQMQEQLERMRSKNNSSSPEAKYWKQYNDERVTMVLLQGKLVDKASLQQIVGFIVTSNFYVADGKKEYRATLLELAVRRTDAKEVADSMSLRPGLWRNTGEQVLLLDYKPDSDMAGMLIRVFVKETLSLEDRRCFYAGIEPGYKEWLALRKPH
jgi:hypothetical protein